MSRKMPPEPRDVLQRRRRGVAAGDPHEVRLADRRRPPTASRTDACAGSKRRLKPIWNGTPAVVDRGQRAVDLGEVERHRLLAEDRLAGARRRDDQVGVGVGASCRSRPRRRRAAEQLLDAAAPARRAPPTPRARRGVRVVDARRPPRPAPGGRAARRACGRSGRRRCTPIRSGARSRSASISPPAARRRPPSGRSADRSSAAWTLTHVDARRRSPAGAGGPRRPSGRTRSPRSRRGPRSRCRCALPGTKCPW